MLRAMVPVALVLLCAAAQGGVLRPEGVQRFFVTPGQKTALQWRIESETFAAPLDYTVRDYWGKQVVSGRATVVEEKTAQVAVQLAPGFYDVEFPKAKERFGILALTAFEGELDPFFAIDSALSWLVRGDAVREGLVQGLRRSGVGMSRERVSWGQIHREKDTWDWETDRHYETLRKTCAKHGVAVLDMFHDSPAWPGRVEKYPDDLAATARSWQAIARRWRPTWGAFEVWNEPDIFFGGNLPADQYVALVKTFAWAFGEAGIDVPLVGGVFAHCNAAYLDCATRNGMLECIDVASFHTYSRAPQMERLVRRYRDWVRSGGKETMPLWLTECGRPWKRGPERPPMGQDAESALDVTMKAVEARACGVAVHFPFVYPYYDERTSNFGMMGKRGTPLRSMAAYAQMVRTLAHTRYLGDLAIGDKGVQRARVFGSDEETVAVLYTGKPEATRVVPLGIPIRRIEGIDGRPLQVGQDGAARVPDGMAYVWLDRGRLGDRLRTDTPAMQLYRVAQQPAPKPAAPSPIVLRFQLDPAALAHKPEGYRVKAIPPGMLTVRVRAFNLSGAPREVALAITVSRETVMVRGGAQRSLTIPPQGHADTAWEADLSKAFAASDRLTATVTATGEGAGRILPLSIDLFGEAPLEQVKERYKKPVALPVADLTRWRANIVGDGKMTMAKTEGGAWRLEATFAEGDPWVYPYFALPEDVDLRRARALVLKARCHKPAIVRVFLWEGDTGVGYLTPNGIVPADGQWHTATVRFDDLRLSGANRPDPNGRLDLGTVRKISIGLNGEAKTNVLEVSDLYLVGE